MSEELDSPLKEVDSAALDALLARDPENLTIEDKGGAIALLVGEARRSREAWEKKDEEAHAGGKHGRGPKREIPEGARTIYDLGLD